MRACIRVRIEKAGRGNDDGAATTRRQRDVDSGEPQRRERERERETKEGAEKATREDQIFNIDSLMKKKR